MNGWKWQWLLGIVLSSGITMTHAQSASTKSVCNDSAIDERSEIIDSLERKERRVKNISYNSNRDDLTKRSSDRDYFIEHVTPRGLPVIPSDESSDIFVGEVLKLETFLSDDKSTIYTEITISVETLLLNKSKNLISGNRIAVLDEKGGAIKLRSGQILRYEIQIDGRGKVCTGRRYVFFVQKADKHTGYNFIRAYELSEGKVFTVDTGNKKLISEKFKISESFSNERKFLKLIRREIENNSKVK